jgi:2-keto-4-pentenoate hydratase
VSAGSWEWGVGSGSPVISRSATSPRRPSSAQKPRYRALAGGDIQLHADGELCVELGRDLDARPDREATSAAVACCWPAIEIVDLAPLPGEPESVVAGNVFHRGVLFGDTPVPMSAATSVTGSVNGTPRERAAWPDDIPARIAAAAAILGAVGERLRAGDRIIAGSIIQAPVAVGARVRVDFGDCATLTIDLVEKDDSDS